MGAIVSHVRRGGLLGGVVVLVASALAASALAAGTAAEPNARACGPAAAETVFKGSKARLYVVDEHPGFDQDGMFSVGGDSELYGCLLGQSRSWRLDRRFEYFTAGFFWLDSIRLRAPWVALDQMTLFHIDTGRRDLIVANLRTGKSYTCSTSETLEGHPSDLVVGKRGRVGWLGEMVFHNPNYQSLPTVAICGSGGLTILESGPGIEPGSLRAAGSSFQWINAGASKSYP